MYSKVVEVTVTVESPIIPSLPSNSYAMRGESSREVEELTFVELSLQKESLVTFPQLLTATKAITNRMMGKVISFVNLDMVLEIASKFASR
jgi:hypothetical protein